MSCFSNKSSCEIIYLASSFSIAISNGLSCDDINTLSAFFSAVGDNLAIIASKCSDNPQSSSNQEC